MNEQNRVRISKVPRLKSELELGCEYANLITLTPTLQLTLTILYSVMASTREFESRSIGSSPVRVTK